jgi:hypothetical protein
MILAEKRGRSVGRLVSAKRKSRGVAPVLVKRDPLQVWMTEFANSFSRRHSLKCKRRSIFVVFGFPFPEFSSKIPFMLEMPSLIKLLRIGFVASLDLPVHLRAAWRYVFAGNAEVRKMPGELGPE